MAAEEARDVVVSDAITDLEERFPLRDLLALEYFQKYRHDYYRRREEGWQVPPRNYFHLLQYLSDIYEYQPDDARSFAKSFKTGSTDWRNSEATFAEVIVYRYYVRLSTRALYGPCAWGERSATFASSA